MGDQGQDPLAAGGLAGADAEVTSRAPTFPLSVTGSETPQPAADECTMNIVRALVPFGVWTVTLCASSAASSAIVRLVSSVVGLVTTIGPAVTPQVRSL